MNINNYIDDLPNVESASFDEYAKLMQLYILAAKKSNSFEGTKRLLTELYPDNAHFIYELLQNAEDAEANTVCFILKPDRLIFKHDGKREFTLKDVKGITNIGNSTKKDDHTKVGKFGVGFKSVFAFTDKPSIYSKDFNFEIRDMLLPVKISPNSHRKEGETLFVFPFKGNIQERQKYKQQIERELQSLDENTIMFLDNICRIEYVLENGIKGYVHKQLLSEQQYEIEVSARKEVSRWLIFNKNLNEHIGQKNKLHVNVAYALKAITNGWSIVPVKGTVNIFFPAVKEDSGLRFNVNGPFASTVARDSIRECDENKCIFQAIADLAAESMVFIKSKGMISMALYETMPNNEDLLNDNYSIIRERLLNVFNTEKFVLSEDGKCYRASELVRTVPGIQNVFLFSEIKKMMQYSEWNWCCTIPVRNKNCRAFFDSLNMRTFTYRTLSKVFDDTHRSDFESLISSKDIAWFRNFYLLLIDLSNSYQEGRLLVQYPVLMKNLRTTKMIYSSLGTLKCADEIYINVNGMLDKDGIFVNEHISKIRELASFWKLMDIKEYNDAAAGSYVLKNLEKYQYPSDAYFDDLLKLAKLSNRMEISDYSIARIWFAEEETSKYAAKNIYLDVPYEKTGYSYIACIIKDVCALSHIYKKHYVQKDLETIISFAKAIGVNTGIQIIKSNVKKNPLYMDTLYKYSDNVTALSTSEDYSISGLDDLLDAKSVPVSRLLWNYMINLQTLPRYCKASFSPNRTTPPRKCDSYLIQRFREKAWIPSKEDGIFYKPADMSRELLLDDFTWNDDSVFTNLISFATDKNKVLLQSEKLISDWGVDAESEQAKALRALLSNPQMAAKILTLVDDENDGTYNLTEAISAQTRHGLNQEDAGEFEEDGRSVKNVERRSKKIKEQLEEGLKKPKAFKKISFVSRTKSSQEERIFLEEQYHGRCQICGQTIKKWNGQLYFEGINLIDTKTLSEQYKKSLETGWNSLCLCPNHAAIYKYGAIDLSDIPEKIMSTSIIDKNNELIKLPIHMQNKEIDILYSPKHFLALKSAFEFFMILEKE